MPLHLRHLYAGWDPLFSLFLLGPSFLPSGSPAGRRRLPLLLHSITAPLPGLRLIAMLLLTMLTEDLVPSKTKRRFMTFRRNARCAMTIRDRAVRASSFRRERARSRFSRRACRVPARRCVATPSRRVTGAPIRPIPNLNSTSVRASRKIPRLRILFSIYPNALLSFCSSVRPSARVASNRAFLSPRTSTVTVLLLFSVAPVNALYRALSLAPTGMRYHRRVLSRAR